VHRRLLMIVACASLIGLLSSFLVYRVVSQVAAKTQDDHYDKIVVAAKNMGLADTVSAENVKLLAWPKASVPAGALRSVDAATGRVVRSSLVAGEPLLEGKLAPHLSGKGGIMPILVPEGQRGVTIKVDDAVKESGFVLPNSRVDILANLSRVAGSEERIAKVILQDVLVLAAGQSVEMRDSKPVTVTTVTFALRPEQVERLAVAQGEGRLMLATRNMRDNGIVETRGATPTSLLGDARVATPRTVSGPERPAVAKGRPSPVAASAPLPAPRLEGHTVAVIRGAKVSEQSFVRLDGHEWIEQKEGKAK